MTFSLESSSRLSSLRSTAAKAAALGLLAAVVGTGCVRIFTTTIPNPLKSGAVAKNNLSFKRRWKDNQFSLAEGTFSHFATLTSLDAKNVCFNVILSSDGDRPREADPKGYTWRLSGSHQLSLNNATVTPDGAIERQVMAGEKDIVEQTTEKVCPPGVTDQKKCSTRRKSTTKRVAADITVLRGRAAGCFPHNGAITASTSHIMLSLNSVNFKWNLQ